MARPRMRAAGAADGCSDSDGYRIERCIDQLRHYRAQEAALLQQHYIEGIPKRALARKIKLSEGMVRMKLQTAEGFIAGCLAAQETPLEMAGLFPIE